jgi:2-phosphosulfolactate phosphatase
VGVDIWGQAGNGVRLEWGAEGVAALGSVCAVLVVVDVLSFSTTVDLVVGRGSAVLPLRWRDARAAEAANAAGAVLAGEREWTLRPSSVVTMPPSTLFGLPSPNGATLCAAAAETGAHVFAGCLRNAATVAKAAHDLADGNAIGVIPAGERWGVNMLSTAPEAPGPLRPCVEDQLGAGAIVAALLTLARSASAEARLAASAYAATDVGPTLTESAWGRELIAAGHAGDVELASRVNVSTAAPRLVEGVLRKWH